MAFVVASASLAVAVIPTTVPMATFSSTASTAASESAGAETLNSSMSPIAMLKTRVVLLISVEVARTVMLWLTAVS